MNSTDQLLKHRMHTRGSADLAHLSAVALCSSRLLVTTSTVHEEQLAPILFTYQPAKAQRRRDPGPVNPQGELACSLEPRGCPCDVLEYNRPTDDTSAAGGPGCPSSQR